MGRGPGIPGSDGSWLWNQARWPVSPFVSWRTGSSHSRTVTVSLVCQNYHCCSCSGIQHSGVSLTFGDAFQRWCQQRLTFALSYGECLDPFLTRSEILECGSPELLYSQWRLNIFGCLTAFRQTCVICFGNLRPVPSIWHLPGCQSTFPSFKFRVSCHDKPKTRLCTFVGTTKTSDSSTSLTCSIDWNKRLPFRLSFPDIITRPGWRWMLVRLVARVSEVGSVIWRCSLHHSQSVLWHAACCHVYLVIGTFCGRRCLSECITGLPFGFRRLPLKATALVMSWHGCLHCAYWTWPIWIPGIGIVGIIRNAFGVAVLRASSRLLQL